MTAAVDLLRALRLAYGHRRRGRHRARPGQPTVTAAEWNATTRPLPLPVLRHAR